MATLPPHYSDKTVAEAFGVDVNQVQFLGRGSFGETWRVQDEDGLVTACKIIYNTALSPERLHREIMGLKRVDHPGVVTLRHHRDLIIGDSTQQLLRFDYVPGGDMADAISQGRRPTRDEAVALLRRLLDAVRSLHDADIVHRDIKPANIALRHGDWRHPVILDLGLARPLDATTLTAYPQQVGTLPYMAPEQLRGERATKPADLWAVGVVLVEAITGENPVMPKDDEYDSEEDFIRTLLHKQSQAQDQIQVDLPLAPAAIVRQLLAFKSYRRSKAHKLLERLDGGR